MDRAVKLSELTTLGLGGPAKRFVSAQTEESLIALVQDADARGEPVLVIGGGSNLVVCDEGFEGLVVRVDTRGLVANDDAARVTLEVAAGEPWDELVGRCVSEGWSGVECLAGIPGRVGATPMQNVGAYGQEVRDTITRVRVWDRQKNQARSLDASECRFQYRSSMLKDEAPRFLVISVAFSLIKSVHSAPIRYAELARALGVAEGDRAPLAKVRETVITLRRGKGMVLDASDSDATSAGSFFMNPTLAPDELRALDARVADRLGQGVVAPRFPADGGKTKVAAAWLIERAGFGKGYGHGKVGISSKHALALVNRGGATTAELLALAREIRDGVRSAFGVTLVVEPQTVGCVV